MIENTLVWISGNSRYIAITNLIMVYETKSQNQSSLPRYIIRFLLLVVITVRVCSGRRLHTVKINNTKGTAKCCLSKLILNVAVTGTKQASI